MGLGGEVAFKHQKTTECQGVFGGFALCVPAGLEAWPRLFHNLRSSWETELLETFPVPVVSLWMGHDAKVCLKHYAQTTDDHYARAVGGAKSGAAGDRREMHRTASGDENTNN